MKRLWCFLFGHVLRWSPDDADDHCRRCGSPRDSSVSTFDKIVAMARACPSTYGDAGNSFGDYSRHKNVVALSELVRSAGFQNLSKAVACGTAWARRLSRIKEAWELRTLEEEASMPGYSWRDRP